MANVLTLDKESKKIGTEKKVESFMTRHRGLILGLGIFVLAVALVACVCFGVLDSQRKKGVAAVESIEYAYTNGFDALTDEEIVARQNTALESLVPYTKKSGVVGVRANMLAADIYTFKKDYVNGIDYWLKAAELSKDNYTAALCRYNAGVCSEESGDVETALSYYEAASTDTSFLLKPHVLFNIARLKEGKGDYAGAQEAYQTLTTDHPSSEWADLAQTRLIQLKLDGKISN
jgi:tetratricopeptide (TPR) repeat protein